MNPESANLSRYEKEHSDRKQDDLFPPPNLIAVRLRW